jgi:putative membrane protein insertion efficiency factor
MPIVFSRARCASLVAGVLGVAVLSCGAASRNGIALVTIHAYQKTLAPIAAHVGVRCRFEPTCSRYAEAVIARDGLLRGGWKTMERVARCGPWVAAGTRDDP